VTGSASGDRFFVTLRNEESGSEYTFYGDTIQDAYAQAAQTIILT
jgi:hypothetical protein